MRRTVNSCFVTLLILCLWRAEETADACSCAPAHPQQAYCDAEIVMRARVVGREEVEVGNNLYGAAITQIKYDIKQIKMFKGPRQHIDAIYTASSSAMCGVSLKTDGSDYLITGRLNEGKMYTTLCQLYKPWDDLSHTQRIGLSQRYEMGCDCRITRCTSLPCVTSSSAECLWTDWVTEQEVFGDQATNYACIKRNDDSCAWYRGTAPPKKDFLDIEDP